MLQTRLGNTHSHDTLAYYPVVHDVQMRHTMCQRHCKTLAKWPTHATNMDPKACNEAARPIQTEPMLSTHGGEQVAVLAGAKQLLLLCVYNGGICFSST